MDFGTIFGTSLACKPGLAWDRKAQWKQEQNQRRTTSEKTERERKKTLKKDFA